MTQRDYDSVTGYDDDPHDALFGGDEDERDPRAYPVTRADRRRAERDGDHGRRRRSRRGWVVILAALVLVAAVALLVVPRVLDYFKTDDYSGDGASNPTATVTVRSGDTASDIGDALHEAKIVASSKAFTEAADADPDAANIQPGVYKLHEHQSGKSALAALLDPSSRDASNDALVTEGANVFTVTDQLTKVLGANQRAAIVKALADPAQLGVPVDYNTADGKVPSSVEGFLYPATYTFDPGTSASDALGKMVSRFIQAVRDSDFAASAKGIGVSPYDALIVASIIQGEAKFDDDMPKVAEVIYNRLRDGTRLQIDATTKYGCEIANEKNCIYNNFPTAYNSYQHDGLPPTPIDNPGAQALAAAVNPAKGKLVFYVNGDKEGHLAFFDNEQDFAKAVTRCQNNNWGC